MLNDLSAQPDIFTFVKVQIYYIITYRIKTVNILQEEKFMMTGFGKKLSEIRHSAGFTQKQLADNVHVSKGTISNYEAEERLPSLVILKDLAKTLHVSADYLLGMEESTQTLDISGLTAEEIQFLYLAVKLLKRNR